MRHRYSDALRRAAPVLAQEPYGLDALRCLAEWERQADEPDDAGWDTAQALYWHAAEWHGGQWSPLYSILSSVLDYHPGPLEAGPEPDTVAEMILFDLDALARGLTGPEG